MTPCVNHYWWIQITRVILVTEMKKWLPRQQAVPAHIWPTSDPHLTRMDSTRAGSGQTLCCCLDQFIPLPLQKKKSHILIFHWTAFSFDYGKHSPWHQFNKLLPYAMSQHLFPSRVAFIIRQDLVWWWLESNRCTKSIQHIPKFLGGC